MSTLSKGFLLFFRGIHKDLVPAEGIFSWRSVIVPAIASLVIAPKLIMMAIIVSILIMMTIIAPMLTMMITITSTARRT